MEPIPASTLSEYEAERHQPPRPAFAFSRKERCRQQGLSSDIQMQVRALCALCFTLLLLALSSCRQQASRPSVRLSPQHRLEFLDSLSAAQAIVRDEAEGFFEKITPLDMALQMGRPLAGGVERETILREYRSFLQRDVEGFSPQEEELLKRAFQPAFELSRQLQPALFPASARLIKTRGRHYGPSVFYTRENCVVIPENELYEDNLESLVQVMLHEVFHIYSRYHPEQREALYRLIGFSPLPLPLSFPDSLARRLLLNPDGISLNCAITLKAPEDSLPAQAIPLIVSGRPDYTPALPHFFDYLEFRLYPVLKTDGEYRVSVEGGYRSPLPPPAQLPAFFAQVGDNTGYIIHPDEILADNFVLLAMSKTGKPAFSLSRYSRRGQEILKRMEEVLQKK